jgi:hypothetical protein
MPGLLRFAATAIVDQLSGVQEITTPSHEAESLLASTPLGAARTWYWRLTEEERSACARVVVSAWRQPTLTLAFLYTGPDVVFLPKEGWRQLHKHALDRRPDGETAAAS